MNLSVRIGKLKLKNPVTVASGTFGHAEEYYNLEEVKKLGALVPKTITLRTREGNPPPRIVETASGMLNAIGIENPGVGIFIKEKLPLLRKIGIPLIISISADSNKEFVQLAKKLNQAKGVNAIECNLSCPNLKKKVLVAQDAKATYEAIKAVKKVSRVPVIAKLSPNVTNIANIAKAAQDAGADAVSLVNTFMAMAIDVERKKPVLGNVSGGLSGPAIKPIALYMVYQVAQKVKIPIIAMGGIANAHDALEFLMAGASMIAVGTMNYINPRAPLEILEGIREYMRRKKINNIRQITGSLNVDK
ncbi:MAG: dihydroorotate dehydrogenase [Candidatus Omnitrophota bacterium]